MMKTMTVKRNKSFEWSVGIHLSIVLLGFLPLAHRMMQQPKEEYLVELGYVEMPETKAQAAKGCKPGALFTTRSLSQHLTSQIRIQFP